MSDKIARVGSDWAGNRLIFPYRKVTVFATGRGQVAVDLPSGLSAVLSQRV